jgi:signal transduction histidine kinase
VVVSALGLVAFALTRGGEAWPEIMDASSALALVLGAASVFAALLDRGHLSQIAGALLGLTVAAIGARLIGAEGAFETPVSLIGLGLALALTQSSRAIAAGIAQVLSFTSMLAALAALLRHAYTVKVPYGVLALAKMPIALVVAVLLLGLAVLGTRAQLALMAPVTEDSPAGFVARRLYPVVVGIPLTLGVLTLVGEEAHLYRGKFGLSLLVLALIVVFVVAVTLLNRSFARADRARGRLAAVLLADAERRNIARELHDEVGQTLTALKVRIEMNDHDRARMLVADAIKQVSDLSLDLRPAMLDDLGLLPALLWLLERYSRETGIEVAFAHDGIDRRFTPDVETAAFRIVQEALSNVARHAGTKTARVQVSAPGGLLVVQVIDEGSGFEAPAPNAPPRSSGLIGMRERAVALGGRIAIDSAPGRGTRLEAQLPTQELVTAT